MIQWANTADTDRWGRRWVSRWCPSGGTVGNRNARAATILVDLHETVALALADAPAPAPGGRLVLVLRVHCGALGGVEDWLAVLDGRDLAPEVPHLCQPVPGTPSFSLSWLARHAFVSGDGFSTVGLVLARRLDDPTLRRATFTLIDEPPMATLHYSLPPGRPIPLPLAKDGKEGLSAEDVAVAFGLRLADCRVILDELVWSGVLSMTAPASRPRRSAAPATPPPAPPAQTGDT